MGRTGRILRVMAATSKGYYRRIAFSDQSQACYNYMSGMEKPIQSQNFDKAVGEVPDLRNERIPERYARKSCDYEGDDKLWRDLLADSSKWWDNRPSKGSPKAPDFKHKQTGQVLWLGNKMTPAWVQSEIISVFGSESEKLERLWREFFLDPSKWWDKRTGKENPRHPDFQHKKTGEILWLGSRRTPTWVSSKLSALKSDDYDLRWQDLFSNPSQWWDHRQRKGKPRFPDFIHKQSGECLWLEGRQTPSWVASKVASFGPGTLREDLLYSIEMLYYNNRAGRFLDTIELFTRMEQKGIIADCYIFLRVLHACTALGDLNEGKRIHARIIETGWELNPNVSSSLVSMYAKCGSLKDARSVFDKMPVRDIVSWTAMMGGYVKCGQGLEALKLFQRMQREEVEPDRVTFVSLINACASTASLEEGRVAHQMIIRSGCEAGKYVRNSLVDMYAKCGSIDEALQVFSKMPSRDLVSWNAVITGCVKCEKGALALELFQQMQLERVEPSATTFTSVLNACASIPALNEGRRIHQLIIQTGYESQAFVVGALVDMYAKCGSMEDAFKVFNKLPTRDLVSWTAMIVGYVKSGNGPKALELYQQMKKEDIEPDSLTFVSVLNACSSVAALDEGRRVHQLIIRRDHECDIFVGSALIDMYAKCGSIEDARIVFDKMPNRNVVSWNSMMMGFAMHGLAKEAVALFEQMLQSGSEINEITFICLLSACSHGRLVKEGVQYFECMQSVYGVTPTKEHYTIMVDILGRAGRLEDAKALIESMPLEPCAATWMALLGSCRIHGNVQLGDLAFKRVMVLDPTNTAGYVLLSNLHAAAGSYKS